MGNCMHCGEKGVDHRHYSNCPELNKKYQGMGKIMDQKKTVEGIEAKVLGFLAEGTHFKVLGLDQTIESLGYDSIDILDITMEMEESYGIKIPDEDYENWKTAQDIVDTVASLCELRFADCEKKNLELSSIKETAMNAVWNIFIRPVKIARLMFRQFAVLMIVAQKHLKKMGREFA